jgi:Protein of unknown function with HXXEE motif
VKTILFGWPYLGLAVAPLFVLLLAFERRPAANASRWNDPLFVLPLLWPMYLVHQFEEHGVDLLGRHYAFLSDLCATLGHAGNPTGCPADAPFIFAVNAVGCQIAFALPFFFRRKNPLVAACAWGIPLVNGVTHVVATLVRGVYNPGVLTSVLLFAPLCAWMLRTVIRAGAIERRQVPRIVAAGVAVHVVLMGSLLLREHGVLSHGALLFINAANGLVPVMFGTLGVKQAAAPAKRGE